MGFGFSGLQTLVPHWGGGGVAAPVADFSADDTTPLNSQLVTFTDLSANTPTSWDWDFGDGSAHATTQNPAHTYATPGTYTVTLIVTNAGGSDTEVKTNYITVTLDPATIANLVRWFDFSDISTLWQDSGATTPVTADGDVIGAIDDKSVIGDRASQGTTSVKPTYKTGIQNGRSVGRFDGGDMLAMAASVSASVSNYYILAAMIPTGAAGTNWRVLGGASFTPAAHLTDAAGKTGYFSQAWVSIANAVAGVQLTEWSLNNAGSEMFRNGASIGTGAYAQYTWTTPSIGAAPVSVGWFIGDVLEILIFTRILNATEKSQLRTWINNKWAIY